MKSTVNIILGLLACVYSSCSIHVNKVPGVIYPSADLVIPNTTEWAKAHYKNRITEFKKNPLAFNDIVFLGNSITEQGGVG